jgi:GntR family transcriptional regulator
MPPSGAGATSPHDTAWSTASVHGADLRVDKHLPTPAYLQLADRIRSAIEAGVWPVGRALPSERELAARLGLSRMTVRRAIEELAQHGFAEQRHGSGTYVRGRAFEQTVDRVIGFSEEARLLGFRPGSRLLAADRVEVDAAVAAALGCTPGTLVLRIARIRTADDVPLALQVAYLRPALVDLPTDGLARGESLYRAVAQHSGLTAKRARQTVSARLPTREERSLLGVGPHEPVLALERTTFDASDSPFEHVRSAYRGDRYALALDLRAPEGS